MRMQKRKFRIGHVAQALQVKHFVIRFWEKEFDITPLRSHGNQRFYDEKDIKKFQLIKDLLYAQKFTIAGAKKHLKMLEHTPITIVPARSAEALQPAQKILDHDMQPTTSACATDQFAMLYKQLIRLRELL